MQDGVVLDDAFAGEDDVFGSEDGGAAGDFVACFLDYGLGGSRIGGGEKRVMVGGEFTVSMYSPRTEGLGGITFYSDFIGLRVRHSGDGVRVCSDVFDGVVGTSEKTSEKACFALRSLTLVDAFEYFPFFPFKPTHLGFPREPKCLSPTSLQCMTTFTTLRQLQRCCLLPTLSIIGRPQPLSCTKHYLRSPAFSFNIPSAVIWCI